MVKIFHIEIDNKIFTRSFNIRFKEKLLHFRHKQLIFCVRRFTLGFSGEDELEDEEEEQAN